MPILGVVASAFKSGITGAFEPIAVATVPSGGVAGVTFGNIPQTYSHLQMRYVAKRNDAVNTSSVSVRFNLDDTASYTRHELYGDGSAMAVSNATSQVQINICIVTGTSATSTFGAGVIDVLDYTNTNKTKTIRVFSGADVNGAGNITFASGLWNKTQAINSMSIVLGSDLVGGSRFALYGIKGA